MNTAALAGKAPATRIRLGAHKTAGVAGRRGLSIHCLQGLVWITREGDVRDYILLPGLRFIASDTGRIVISGMTEDNVVEVGTAPTAGARINVCQPLRMDWAHIAQMGDVAQRARAGHVAAVLHGVYGSIACLLRVYCNPHGIDCRTRPEEPNQLQPLTR